MKAAVFLAVAMFATVVSCYELPNPDDVIKDPARLDTYVNCLLDEKKCSPESRSLRSCATCTDAQKVFIKKTSVYLAKNRPSDWKKITDHLDKDGEYKESLKKLTTSN
uniref:Chemosensory protein n=1 Tax=Timema shepardi TaxID=629360 RepID=A0A7R9B743_TIMSH|nr:unnamed protein product [Timema shepardi]